MTTNIILDTFKSNAAGYIVSKGRKYITVEYLTTVSGDSDKTYKVAIDEFEAMPGDTVLDKAMYITEVSGIKPVKTSKVF